jgi:osmotically-inducible protein OsmY
MADHDNRWRDDRIARRPGGERDFYGRDERGEDDYGRGFGEEGMTNYRLRRPSGTGLGEYGARPDYGGRDRDFSGRGGYGGYSDRSRPRDFGSDVSSDNEYGARRHLSGSLADDDRTRRQWNDRRYGNEERGWWDRASDEVSSWFGDDDADRRRRLDARHEGRGPKGYRRSDDRIREDVSDRLTDDPYVDATEIEIVVADAEVTLTGSVDSRNARRRAEDLAERVSGVTHVQNNLRVSSGSETVREERTPGKAGLFSKS